MDNRFITQNLDDNLAHLSEECGELIIELARLIAAIGKTQRFGVESVNPLLANADQETNKDWIRREMRDVEEGMNRVRAALQRHDEQNPIQQG